ncbi:MAG TPA: PD-(D/E)XK nuclease family protein [Spirillospora sp.]|nr:PD-(D/E)XK nuclease family protein [Spirillospora sp.]
MNLTEDFVFSQGSLQDYVDCPRRFQLRYLLGQRWPAPEVDDLLAFEQRLEQGAYFHHLIHQHQAGIPADVLRQRIEDADVRRWFEAYLRSGLDGVPDERRPETTLMVPLGDYLLLAKFDLLAVQPGQRALIIDWKTAHSIPTEETLLRRLQTVVYRYVLARGGDHLNGGQPIPPEQIEMVYWYADHDGATRRLPYDATQFAADEAYLLDLVREIDRRADFPLTPDQRRCRFCVYRSLCDRGIQAGSLAEWDDYEDADLTEFAIDLEQIAEIEF